MVASELTAQVLPSEIAAIRAAGGRVHYVFNVPIARVEIDRDQIPELVRSPDGVAQSAEHAHRSTSPRSFSSNLLLASRAGVGCRRGRAAGRPRAVAPGSGQRWTSDDGRVCSRPGDSTCPSYSRVELLAAGWRRGPVLRVSDVQACRDRRDGSAANPVTQVDVEKLRAGQAV